MSFEPKIKTALELMPKGLKEDHVSIIRNMGGFYKVDLLDVIEVSKKLTTFTKQYYGCNGTVVQVYYEKKNGNQTAIKWEIVKNARDSS